jgi:hypothetical protein
VTIGGVLPFGRTRPDVPPPYDEIAEVEGDQRETPGLEPDPQTGDLVMELVTDAQEIVAEAGRDAHDELLRQAHELPEGAEVDPRSAPPRR